VITRLIAKRKRTRCRLDQAQPDETGAAMVLALMLLVIGSMIVAALSNYVISDFRALPTIRARTDRAEALKGANRIAINLQRDAGPTACASPVSQYTVNGYLVTTECTEGAAEMLGGTRYGLVSTSNKNDAAHIIGTGSSGYTKRITSPIFINAGRLNPSTQDVMPTPEVTLSTYTSATSPVARYSTPSISTPFACNNAANAAALAASDLFKRDPATAITHNLVCQAQPWWTAVGDKDANGVRQYPPLPPMPTYDRATSTGTSYTSTCRIFYPGRYQGSTALVLNSAINYYFASGVYYFERPIQISGGARVVMGSGPASQSGCVPDIVAGSRISNPDISGRGATLIFGGNASLDVRGANTRLTINQRVATTATAASEGQSIRTVATGVATANIEIPRDNVMKPDGTIVAVTSYDARLTPTSPARLYAASTLTHDLNAVAVKTDSNVRVIVPGFVITPHARFFMDGSGTTPLVRFSGGLVASEFKFISTSTPAASGWTMGAVPNVGLRSFSFVTELVAGDRTLTSRATLELDANGQFAVSQWAVNI
jgi:hypothetical protein